jgi:hypothetical protein
MGERFFVIQVFCFFAFAKYKKPESQNRIFLSNIQKRAHSEKSISLIPAAKSLKGDFG